MQILSQLSPRSIAPTLMAGVALAIVATGLRAQEAPSRSEQIDQQIQRLIEQLGDDDYFVRERAQSELAKFSFEAFEALNAATTHEDLEIATRAKYLLRLMRVQWTTESDPPEVKRLLKDYEIQNTATRVARMRSLAGLPGGAGIPALCRLIRYEKSGVLSRQAAMELLTRQPHDKPPPKELAETLRRNLASSRRTAARWLLTWLRFHDDPEAGIADWTKLVEAEHSLLGRSPTESNAKIVAGLVRVQIEWLKRLKRKDEAVAAMRRLVDLEQGKLETLAELLDWLIEQEAWKVVDELATRFPTQFASNPVLLYTLAQAQVEQGDQQRAEQTAAKALMLNPGNDPRQLQIHGATGEFLRRRGLFKWAEREYRHVFQSGIDPHPVTISTQFIFAEMLHDQSKELEAAEVLQDLAKVLEKLPNAVAVIGGIGVEETRSRMNFFFACHEKSKDNPAKHREYLKRALEADPSDVDVLIACYRLPGQTPEDREKTRQLIKKAAAELRQQIADLPDSPTAYNQLAWLVGNTEGDFDEALRLSKKSIELSPDSGGYYDTLAHVYFAKGDYENAVKTQTKAAQLEPHSGLIAGQLEVFRKKWEEEKKKR